MPIINGRLVNTPSSIYGTDLIREANPGAGRRAVIHKPGGFQTVEPTQRYTKDQLVDKKGNPVKITTIPDRSKGSFGGARSALSRRIITEQVYNVAEHLFKAGVNFDEDNGDWMMVPEYYLPANWHRIARSSPLLIMFPTEYPELPPIGFYLKDNIDSPNGHFFNRAYHEAAEAPLQKGWKWYCCEIKSGAWRPSRSDWKRGDNLWTYCTLINEVLASCD